MSLRDEIVSSSDLTRQRVECPEWTPESLYVRTMTCEESESFEELILKKQEAGANDHRGMKSLLVCLTLTDESGERVFDCNGDVARVKGKSAAVVNRIANAALEVNGYNQTDIEDLEKNSREITSGSSG